MLTYLYRSRPTAAISRNGIRFWTSGGGLLANFLHPTEPKTLSQLSGAYLSEYGWQCPPTTTPAAYLPYLMCGLLEHGFARVDCPPSWPTAQHKTPTLAFQLNLSDEAVQRRKTTAVWRTHGQLVGVLLQAASRLTLDEMDAACREYAKRDASLVLRSDNKMRLAESLLALANHDLVQIILPPELHHAVSPLTFEDRDSSPSRWLGVQGS
jgi:hypothetical protein